MLYTGCQVQIHSGNKLRTFLDSKIQLVIPVFLVTKKVRLLKKGKVWPLSLVFSLLPKEGELIYLIGDFKEESNSYSTCLFLSPLPSLSLSLLFLVLNFWVSLPKEAHLLIYPVVNSIEQTWMRIERGKIGAIQLYLKCVVLIFWDWRIKKPTLLSF